MLSTDSKVFQLFNEFTELDQLQHLRQTAHPRKHVNVTSGEAV